MVSLEQPEAWIFDVRTASEGIQTLRSYVIDNFASAASYGVEKGKHEVVSVQIVFQKP